MDTAASPKYSISKIKRKLRAQFPAVFGPIPKPLRVGIYNDILGNLGTTDATKALRGFLALHTRSRTYLETVARGGARYALDGTVDGEVAPHEIVDANSKLKKLDDDVQAYALRAQFLKVVIASGKSLAEYAKANGMELDKATSDYDRASYEREVRRNERRKIVKAYMASGASLDDFATQRGISAVKLQRMIDKVATYPEPVTVIPS